MEQNAEVQTQSEGPALEVEKVAALRRTMRSYSWNP